LVSTDGGGERKRGETTEEKRGSRIILRKRVAGAPTQRQQKAYTVRGKKRLAKERRNPEERIIPISYSTKKERNRHKKKRRDRTSKGPIRILGEKKKKK